MKKSLALTCILLLLPSCATMFQGGPDVVHVGSTPSGATVQLDGAHVGTTPCQITVQRTATGVLTVTKPGYHPYSYRIPTSVNGTTFLNILQGLYCWIGFVVDGVTGNITRWAGPVNVTLAPVKE